MERLCPPPLARLGPASLRDHAKPGLPPLQRLPRLPAQQALGTARGDVRASAPASEGHCGIRRFKEERWSQLNSVMGPSSDEGAFPPQECPVLNIKGTILRHFCYKHQNRWIECDKHDSTCSWERDTAWARQEGRGLERHLGRPGRASSARSRTHSAARRAASRDIRHGSVPEARGQDRTRPRRPERGHRVWGGQGAYPPPRHGRGDVGRHSRDGTTQAPRHVFTNVQLPRGAETPKQRNGPKKKS